MPKVVKYSDEIDYSQLSVKIGGYIQFNSQPIYFQTSYHYDYRIPKESEWYDTIESRSKIICGIRPEMSIYKFYESIDTFFHEQLIKMKTENVIKDEIINYESIFKKNNINYYLSSGKIPKDRRVLQDIKDTYSQKMQNEDHDTAMMTWCDMMEELDKDKYYNYISI